MNKQELWRRYQKYLSAHPTVVGLLPASLEGIEIDGLLTGAAHMDHITRQTEIRQNPSALLALMWYYAGEGKGNKNMVILPYKDRLAFLSRYLQQLIMESLGKEKNLSGEVVHQGITVIENAFSRVRIRFLKIRKSVVNHQMNHSLRNGGLVLVFRCQRY